MSTLLLWLKGPLQSWAGGEGYAHRPTDDYPTKSGVIGLVAGALGRSRQADSSDLAGLRFGVKTLREPKRLTDFQTMGERAPGKPNPLELKDYLMDAGFLVALEGDRSLLEQCRDAIHHPVFMPYLGRRACPPAGPIQTRLTDDSLSDALLTVPGGVAHVESDSGRLWRADQPGGARRFHRRRETDAFPLDSVAA